MKICIIVNPISGNRKVLKEHIRDIKSALDSQTQTEFQILETECPGHATQLAEESAIRRDNICFAVGGDGTMNEVACGLIGSQTTLGIIPTGSGNGLARHLRIPLNPGAAMLALLNGRTTKLDYGTVNNIPFFLASGVGFEGAVAARFAKKKKRGFLSYIMAAAEEYRKWKPIEYQAKYEREVLQGKAFTIDFANGSQYGNNAIISPGAEVNDGLLQFVRVLPFPHYAAPEMLIRLMNGRIDRSIYHIERAFTSLELSIKDRQVVEGHVDGEPIRFQLPLFIEIHPAGLQVRIP